MPCPAQKPEVARWPLISGSATVGQVLTTDGGTWVSSGNMAAYPNSGTAYQWYRDSSPIGGATAGSYTLQSADGGSMVSVRATATNTAGSTTQSSSGVAVAAGAGTFPLSVSSNHRYLQTPGGKLYMIVGDSPQALVVNASASTSTTGTPGGYTSDVDYYCATRQSQGFNALLVDLVCNAYTGGTSTGVINIGPYTGTAPFNSTVAGGYYDLTTPNATYWSVVDSVIDIATSYGLLLLLDPIEAGGWLPTIFANGKDAGSKTYQFGQWLGTRYAAYDNIIWQHGNDYKYYVTDGTYGAPDPYVISVADGIRSTAPSHLQTVGLDFSAPGSVGVFSDVGSRWITTMDIDGTYTWGSSGGGGFSTNYVQNLADYAQASPKPIVLLETFYEAENSSTNQTLRANNYWSILGGALSGGWYGHGSIWGLVSGWQTHLATTAVTQFGSYLTAFFGALAVEKLVPDAAHSVVTAASGAANLTSGSNNYVTAAAAADGTLAVAYLPQGGTITVALGGFAGNVTAQWWDPTNNTYATVSGSPFTNSSTHNFTPTGNNSAGASDWLLLLTA